MTNYTTKVWKEADKLVVENGATFTVNDVDLTEKVIAAAEGTAAHIADVSTVTATDITGTDTVSLSALVTAINNLAAKINAILAALEAFGIIASQ